ncbi:surface-adhesin E family protein [Burkholderia sp. BCC1993]|uniref:surface-adhesin E family protein n=1 Tax=Burkholderia sp. BCC1993 TaxID=2817444 RepID=UPI002AB1E64B|nr:surface-adhesin E family protein [Burkholderia sp. BCC1993]
MKTKKATVIGCAVLLGLCGQAASAANWITIVDAENVQVGIDAESAQFSPDGTKARGWVRNQYSPAVTYDGHQKVSMAMMQYVVDCRLNTFAVVDGAVYDSGGAMVARQSLDANPKEPIPGSVADSVKKALCGVAALHPHG